MPNTKKRAGFLPFLPLLCTLPGVVAAFLGLFLPYADKVTKNPVAETVDRNSMTLSEWATQHEALREIGGEGYAYFGAARSFSWVVAVTAACVFLLLLLSRFDRSKSVVWCCAGAGAVLVLLTVVAFLLSVFFSVAAGSESSRVLLSVAPYGTLVGGTLVGAVSFFAVRRDL